MLGPALEGVFANAAFPQKVVLVLLLAGIPITILAAAAALRAGMRARVWRDFIGALRVAAPALGMLVGGLDSFHMAETIQRPPFDPTLKQLAPGIYEVSTFVSLGALVGL